MNMSWTCFKQSSELINACTLRMWVKGQWTTLNVPSINQFFTCERRVIILSVANSRGQQLSILTSLWKNPGGMKSSAKSKCRSLGSFGQWHWHRWLALDVPYLMNCGTAVQLIIAERAPPQCPLVIFALDSTGETITVSWLVMTMWWRPRNNFELNW